MYKALVCCVAGMGSSMLLKMKADQVVKENQFPIEIIHGRMEDLDHFDGDLIITMASLVAECEKTSLPVIGIEKVVDNNEMKEKLQHFLEQQ